MVMTEFNMSVPKNYNYSGCEGLLRSNRFGGLCVKVSSIADILRVIHFVHIHCRGKRTGISMRDFPD